MADNQLNIKITAGLDTKDSVTRINADIKKIEGQLKQLRLQAKLDNSKTNAEIQKQITALNKQKRQLYVDLKIRQKDLKKQYKQAVSQIDQKPVEIEVKTNNAQKQLSGLSNSVKSANNETVSLGNTLNKTLNNIGLVVSAQTALNTIRQAAQEATEAVKEYDKMSTNLQIITGQSKESVNTMISDLADKSLNYNVDISDLEKAQETLLRTGKSVEDVNYLLKDTIMLAKTGFMDTEDSAESLVTIANAYNYEADEMENVVSKFLALDTASNTVAGKLSTAIAKSAQNAKLAGLSIDKLGGYISTLKDTTGKAESEISTALNSIFSRVYNVKLGKYEAELEDGTTEDITESLNDTERMLKNVGIQLRTSKGEFKDIDDIIKELSEHWNEFNSVEKNSIAKTFAGTMHKNSFISLIENYDKAMQLAEVSAESAGTATKKYSVYMESIEAKSAALSTSLKELWNNLIPNGFVGDITDATTGLVKFTDEYQILQTAIKSATFYALAKGIVSAKNGFAGMITDVKNVSTAMDMVGRYSNLSGQEFETLQAITKNLSDNQLKLVLSTKELTYNQKSNIIKTKEMTDAEAEQKLATLGITQANNAATASTFSLSGAFKTLWATIAANPVMVLTMAFTALVSIYQKVQREQEEARKNAKESAEKYEDQAKSLEELKKKYEEICNSSDDEKTKNEQLNEIKLELIDTYKIEKDNLKELNLEREKGIDLLDKEFEKSNRNARNAWLDKNEEIVQKANEKMAYGGTDYFSTYLSDNNISESILKLFDNKDAFGDTGYVNLEFDYTDTVDRLEKLKNIYNEILEIQSNRKLTEDEQQLLSDVKHTLDSVQQVYDSYYDTYAYASKSTAQNLIENYLKTDSGKLENVGKETFNAWSKGLIEQATNEEEKRYIQKYIEDTFPNYIEYFNNLKTAKSKFVEGKFNAKPISDYIESLSEDDLAVLIQLNDDVFNSGLDNVTKAIAKWKADPANDVTLSLDDEELSKTIETVSKKVKLISTAMEELDDTGYISSSTYAEIIEMGGNFTDCLETQNGKLVINVKKLKELETQEFETAKSATELAIAELKANTSINSASDYNAFEEKLNALQNKKALYDQMIDEINNASPKEKKEKKEKPQSILNFEKEYAEKQHEFNMDQKEKNEDYYSWLLSAAHTAYDGLADYQDDLWKYEEEVYKGRKQLADDFYDEQQKDFEDRISSLEDDIDKAMDGKLTSLVSQSDIDDLNELNQTMQELYQLGNVDLTKRPKVNAETMRKAGYEAEDGETATVYSSFDFLWQGDEEHGKYVAVHYTPILPDGTVLDEKTLNDYLDTLVGSDDILKADTKGIILKVDSDVDVSDADVKSLETDKPTENIQSIIKACEDWDIALHNIQAEWMVLDEAVNNASEMHIEDKFEYIRSAYQEIINEIDGRINEIVQGGIEGHEDDLKKLEEQRVKYSDKLAELPKTAAEEEQTYIKKLKDDYSNLYDERIKKLKKQKEATEKAFKAEIDAIQKKIDALKKVNEKEQEALDIEKARKELEKASQSTRQVYGSDGSISFKADDERIKEAQENLDKVMQEKQINILEKQKQALEDVKTKESEAYDSIIDNLETEKDNSEKRFDILLDALDEYLNPDQGESNSDVWKMLAHLEGATYKNGVWTNKDGKVIDIDELVNTVETATKDDKQNGFAEGKKPTNSKDLLKGSSPKVKDTIIIGNLERKDIGDETSKISETEGKKPEEKAGSVVESFFSNLEKKAGLASGSLTLDKVSDVLKGSFLMRYNDEPFKHQSDVGINEKYSSNVNNNKNNNSVSFNGDIVINNPVSNSDDLAKELMLNIPIAFQKQMYSNLGR